MQIIYIKRFTDMSAEVTTSRYYFVPPAATV